MFPKRATQLFLALIAIVLLVRVSFAAPPEHDPIAGNAMRLLHAQCIGCHNAEKRKGGLELISREKLLAGADSGKIIDSSNPAESLILKVLAADADPHMPPKKQLTAQQIDVLKKWVAAGAPWDEAALARASAPRLVKLAELPPGYQPTFALALSSDGNHLAFGRANELLVYNLAATGFPMIAKIKAHADVVRSVAWSKDGKLLASGGYKEVKLWRLPENEAEKKSESTGKLNLVQAFTAN